MGSLFYGAIHRTQQLFAGARLRCIGIERSNRMPTEARRLRLAVTQSAQISVRVVFQRDVQTIRRLPVFHFGPESVIVPLDIGDAVLPKMRQALLYHSGLGKRVQLIAVEEKGIRLCRC